MSEILKTIQALQSTPVPNLLFISGFIFLLLAFAGRIGAIIELSRERQKWAGITGALLLTLGVVLSVPWPAPTAEDVTPTAAPPMPQSASTTVMVEAAPPAPDTVAPNPTAIPPPTDIQVAPAAPSTVDARSDRISGVLTFRGEPVADLPVALISGLDCRSENIMRRTTTDSHGRYNFDNVTPGSYLININGLYDDATTPLQPFEQTCTWELVKGADDALPLDWSLHKTDLRITFPLENSEIGTTNPTLQWQPYPDATSYAVLLIRDSPDQDTVMDEASIDGTSVSPTSSLDSGATYRLYVWASDSNGQIAVGDVSFQVQ